MPAPPLESQPGQELGSSQDVMTPASPYYSVARTDDPAVDADLFNPVTTDTEPPRAGDIITFFYNKRLYYEIHDQMPMILVLDWNPPQMIRGINLHYLTWNDMGTLAEKAYHHQIWSYDQLKGMNRWWTKFFRTYLWNFVNRQSLKKLNPVWVQMQVKRILSYDPNLSSAIRESIKSQVEKEVNQLRASQMAAPGTTTPRGTIPPLAAVGATPAIPAMPAPATGATNTQNSMASPVGNQ